MRMIFIGPPGAGKGTQSKKLISHLSIPQISTGDILRQAIRDATLVGKQVEPLLAAGKLVPDVLVIEIVKTRLKDADCFPGFVLDGFPRTVAQADALGDALVGLDRGLKHVLSIEVPDSVVVERMAGRRSCPKCGAVFHLTDNPPKMQGVCDQCGTTLIQRQDEALNSHGWTCTGSRAHIPAAMALICFKSAPGRCVQKRRPRHPRHQSSAAGTWQCSTT